MPESDLGGELGTGSGLATSGGSASIGTVRAASDIVFLSADLDCAYKGNRVFLAHPGRDRLKVEVEPVGTTIVAGILKIKTAASEGSGRSVVPNSAIDITTTVSSQTQAGLDVTGQGGSWVEVDTVQADLTCRVRLTAMKS